MLIGFTTRNFRSFLGEQSLSYLPSADPTHELTHCVPTRRRAAPSLLKSLVVFGANGSGKSNLIAALATMRDLVLHSQAWSEEQFAERHTPFRFGPSGEQETGFGVDVLIEGVRYRYDLAYDARQVRWERLLVYQTGKAQRWFERRVDEAGVERWASFSQSFHGPRELWRRATRPTSLFLTTVAQFNSFQVLPLFRWFEHDLKIILPADLEDTARIGAALLDPVRKRDLVTLLRAFDVQVEDVRFVDPVTPDAQWPVPDPRAPRRRREGHIELLHCSRDGQSVWFKPGFESAGIQRLLGLGTLAAVSRHRGLLVIDEFDANLHPSVSQALLRFLNDLSLEDEQQSLLVTHNAALMDLELLRRDEIWLIELDAERASVLTPVLRRRVRKQEQIAKKYLRGRYGGVPDIQRS